MIPECFLANAFLLPCCGVIMLFLLWFLLLWWVIGIIISIALLVFLYSETCGSYYFFALSRGTGPLRKVMGSTRLSALLGAGGGGALC
jgi:hypothetical protein